MTAENIIIDGLATLGVATLVYAVSRLYLGAYIMLKRKQRAAQRTRQRQAERSRRKDFIDLMEEAK